MRVIFFAIFSLELGFTQNAKLTVFSLSQNEMRQLAKIKQSIILEILIATFFLHLVRSKLKL